MIVVYPTWNMDITRIYYDNQNIHYHIYTNGDVVLAGKYDIMIL